MVSAEVELEILRRFGADTPTVSELESNENRVLSYVGPSGHCVLRVSDAGRRSCEEVIAELDWIEFLAAGGVSVARPVPALDGSRVVVSADGSWVASAYEFVQGTHLEQSACPDRILDAWGRLLGRMHVFAKTYGRISGAIGRPRWEEDDQIAYERYLPTGNEDVAEAARLLIARIHSFSTSPEEFGLIHSDLHLRNLLVDGDGVTAVDFDECCLGWFAQDIATSLYYFVRRIPTDDARSAVANRFLRVFLSGYRTQAPLDSTSFAHLTDFVLLRHLVTYVAAFRPVPKAPVTDPLLLQVVREELVGARSLMTLPSYAEVG